jgi:hypothetical protein
MPCPEKDVGTSKSSTGRARTSTTEFSRLKMMCKSGPLGRFMIGCGVLMVMAPSGRGPIEHWRMYFFLSCEMLCCLRR